MKSLSDSFSDKGTTTLLLPYASGSPLDYRKIGHLLFWLIFNTIDNFTLDPTVPLPFRAFDGRGDSGRGRRRTGFWEIQGSRIDLFRLWSSSWGTPECHVTGTRHG